VSTGEFSCIDCVGAVFLCAAQTPSEDVTAQLRGPSAGISPPPIIGLQRRVSDDSLSTIAAPHGFA
jgi:hypothetical protein